MNKILEIKEVYNIEIPRHYNDYEGYKIVTEKDTYYFLISSFQRCCENYGYIASNDNLEDYIGLELVGIDIVDTACNKIANFLNEEDICEAECMFINLKFKFDELQFAVYNSHNGYYGHSVLFIKNNEDIIDGGL